MNKRIKDILLITMMVVVILCLLFWGLTAAQGFLAPIAMAALLAMVVLALTGKPLSWFRAWIN